MFVSPCTICFHSVRCLQNLCVSTLHGQVSKLEEIFHLLAFDEVTNSFSVVRMIGWGAKLSYSENGSSKLAISHVLPVQFVPLPMDAKARFLLRSQRMFAAAQAQREGGKVPPSRKVLRPTPQETQDIYQDWMQLLELIGDGDEE